MVRRSLVQGQRMMVLERHSLGLGQHNFELGQRMMVLLRMLVLLRMMELQLIRRWRPKRWWQQQRLSWLKLLGFRLEDKRRYVAMFHTLGKPKATDNRLAN